MTQPPIPIIPGQGDPSPPPLAPPDGPASEPSVDSPSPQPRRRWLPFALTAAAALAIGVVATALVLKFAGGGDTVRLTGEIHVRGDDNVAGSSTDCRGSRGYDDLREGAQVVITDPAGTTIAVTSLRRGTHSTYGTVDCVLPFAVDVPAGKGFYGVEVTHRGRVQYPEAELGAVSLTIGS